MPWCNDVLIPPRCRYLLLVTTLLAVACDDQVGSGSELRILFSGETLGRLDPCICDGELAGGLEFRRGYIERQTGPHLLLDIGCVAKGTRGLERLRALEVMRRMRDLGYHATNCGQYELALGRAGLAELAAVGVPLVSANVRAPEAPDLIAPFVLSRAAGPPVAITGVADARYLAGDGLSVDPVHEALARLVPRLREQTRAIVVLADLAPARVRTLAADFPEVSVFLFRGWEESHPPELVNRSVIASIYGGRYLGDMTLGWTDAHRVEARSGKAVLLDKRFAAAGTARIGAPPGIRHEPERLAFGNFHRGELHTSTLTLHNDNLQAVSIGRVYSPCTCFAMSVPAQEIPAGGTAAIEVTLHSLDLSGAVNFPLYVEISGAVDGILQVEATATVTGGDPAAEEDQP